jgi:hypothetical protein
MRERHTPGPSQTDWSTVDKMADQSIDFSENDYKVTSETLAAAGLAHKTP